MIDPNLLACDENLELLKQLINTGAYIDITQGLDARLLTAKNIELINELKVKILHFAWDNPRDNSIKSALEEFRKSEIKAKNKVEEKESKLKTQASGKVGNEKNLWNLIYSRILKI